MPPVRVVRSVFRGLLGHAVLVKSCTIETSAAAISRILASIGEKISRFVARLRNKCHVSPRWPHRRSIASFISTRIPRSVFDIYEVGNRDRTVFVEEERRGDRIARISPISVRLCSPTLDSRGFQLSRR